MGNAMRLTIDVEGSPFSEKGGTARVFANVSQRSALDVTVGLQFAGTASNGVDYTASATSIPLNLASA